MSINVLLVDDQTLVREGLSSLLSLSDNVTVVAQASSGKKALEKNVQHSIDVIRYSHARHGWYKGVALRSGGCQTLC